MKEQPEWESMINLFGNDLYTLQDAMIADQPEERLNFLAAKAQMAQKYLTWALERPENQEG